MKLTKTDLVAIIRSHRRDALGVEDGDLSNDRATALDHYHGRPYGDEQDGRSQVVSRDLSETVDWIMPALMKIFLQSGNIAEFTPEGQEDEEVALQESDYTNQVIMKDNPGFLVIHDFCKDALLLKNGYVKHWWDESEKISESEYEGLSEDELVGLMMQLEADGAEVEVKAQDERQELIPGPDGNTQAVPVFDVRLRINRKTGRVRIEAAPPEEIRVSKRCRGSLQESDFVEHVTRKTRSDLIEMGMGKNFVYSLPAYNEGNTDEIEVSRDSVTDESDDFVGTALDRSMDEIAYCEAYLRVDWDDDGIAELRRVVTVADQIPPGAQWNEQVDCVAITGGVPKRVPHRHVGESLDDELNDLQRIKTVLTRQMLDNVYLTNNQQWLVNERVNLPDFMRSLPGGVKRVSGEADVGGAAVAIQTTPILNQILPAIDYIDGVKESRTGINKTTTGLDPDVLKQSTKGAFLENMNRASQKVEMIARMLAETGIKDLVLRVHELLLKHQDKPRTVQLRGKFVSVNPQEWKERTDLTVKVGLGAGNEEEKREKLMLLSGLQDKMDQRGMVGPSQAFNLFGDLSRAMGFDHPEKYIMSPESPEFQQAMQQRSQPPPNPLAEVEQIKGQFKMQADRMSLQHKAQMEQMEQMKMQMKMQMEHQHQMHKLRAEMLNGAAERASKEAIEAAKMEIQALIEGIKIDIGKPGVGAGLQEGQ